MQDTLIAGDTLNFLTSTPDYPASAGWVLKYYLVRRTAGGSPIVLTSVAEGDDHRISVDAATTANWAADSYSWSVRAELGAEKYSVQDLTGQLVVRQNPATAANGFDGRSANRKALDDARQAWIDYTPTRKSYRIGEREVTFNTAADILTKVRYFEQLVQREDDNAAAAAGLPVSGAPFYTRAVR